MSMETPLAPATPSVPNRTIFKLALVLAFAGGIAYSNSFTKVFLLDDIPWISANDRIKDFSAYVASMKSRPVIAASFYLDYRIHQLNLFGYHLANLGIHIAAALALFGLVRRTLLLQSWDGRFAASAHWFAFAVALIWVVHPLHTQAVTYIIQRCESLMGLFFLLTIYCVVRAVESKRPWAWYLASWTCCLLGAGSKEVMVTILPVLLCFDRYFIASWTEMLKRRWWYYLGLVAIWGVPFVVSTLPSVVEADPTASAGFGIPHLRPPVYWMTQASILLYYLRLCVLPYPQSFLYRGWRPTVDVEDFWPAGIALTLIFIAVLWLSWRRHWVGFLGLWFFGILSITSIVPLLDVAFEHRLYLPLAAVSALVVFGGYGLIHWAARDPLAKWIAAAALAAIVIALTVTTFRRNEDYRSSDVMWRSVIQLYPDDHESMNNLAVGLETAEKYDEAIEYFEKCPSNLPGMSIYGMLLCRLDRPEDGLRAMNALLAAVGNKPQPDDPRGVLRFSTRNCDLGKVYFIQGDLEASERHFKNAVEGAPKQAMGYLGLALIRNEQKRPTEADELYRAGIALDQKAPISCIELARFMLNGYPRPSQFTRKEALFLAMQAAQATEYKNADAVEILVEALAANAKFAAVNETMRIATTRLAAGDAERLQTAANRLIAFYQREAELKKNAPPGN
jgi:protein O-mannosyl-transferase